MESIRQTPEPDDSQPPEPTIPMLVGKIGVALSRLLRLVRPAEAGPIRETVDELEAEFKDLLEAILRQAHLQSAGVFAPLLDRLDRFETRLAAIEEARAREVGGGE